MKDGKARNRLEAPWDDDALREALPLPAPDAHKYSRGVLTLVAGSRRYPGAACLASRAGQRMGAGYVQVVTCKALADLVLSAAPSLVVRNVKEWRASELAGLKPGARRAVCIGPGFVPGDAKTDKLVYDVLSQAACPALVDGGALEALASDKGRKALAKRRKRGCATVMTPHVGEAERLRHAFGLSADAPAALGATLAQVTGAIVVVKGPDTFISCDGKTYPMYEGTSALAKAGTGDVLAGMVAALLAQGVEPLAAAVLGVTLHARAGAAAARTFTDIGATPEDVIEAIPAAIRSLGAWGDAPLLPVPQQGRPLTARYPG